MLTILLAAAVAAASPAPAKPLLTMKWGADAPLVCASRFEEQLRAAQAKLPDFKPRSLDLYAEKAKLSKDEKFLLTNYCDMFDLGALYVVMKSQQAQEDSQPKGLRKPFDDIASFRQ